MGMCRINPDIFKQIDAIIGDQTVTYNITIHMPALEQDRPRSHPEKFLGNLTKV